VGGFFGYRPDTAVLGNTGLQLAKGVLVDEHLATDAAGVYAAGDAAQVYSPELKNYWVSVGWGNALTLGQVAAQNLLGTHRDASHAPVHALEVEGVNINTSWWMDI
jgi:3-phenylpropionate/trans-cinnamate dioxygenase ferredoxin reductase subunit